MFNPETVAVVGLHTVFEHHDVMTPAALEVFLHEYRWGFPVGIDEPQGRGLPRTMEAYAMRGTPTLLIFDRTGRLRRHYFGHLDDLVLGAEVMAMVVEDDGRKTEQRLRQALALPDHRRHAHAAGESCDDEGCG